jgi:hypothetical protein
MWNEGLHWMERRLTLGSEMQPIKKTYEAFQLRNSLCVRVAFGLNPSAE